MAEPNETFPVLGDTDECRQEGPSDNSGKNTKDHNRASENAEGRNQVNFTRNLSKESDASIAKKLFFGGLAFLPWLHFLNVFHFRKYLLDATQDPQTTMCKFALTLLVSCAFS